MNFFHENRIDSQTDKALQSNNLSLRSSDNIEDFSRDSSVYGDLSNITKLSDADFVKKLAQECSKTEGYVNRVIYIPLNSWERNTNSPINALIRYIKKYPNKFKELFQGVSFVFVNSSNRKSFGLVVDEYNPSQFNTITGLIDRLTREVDEKLLTGKAGEKKTVEKQAVNKEEVKKRKTEENKKKLVKAVAAATDESGSDDPKDIIEYLEDDEEIINILSQLEDDVKPTIDKTRAARMSKVNKQFLDSSIGKTTVRSLLYDSNMQIEPAHLKVNTINKDEWDNLKFSNFEKSYDLNKDLYAMIYSLTDEKKRYPISILKINVVDNSTSMDYILTYTVNCEDSFGKRFTLKFDIPKFINNRFMMLRGNEKSMSGQLMLLPCLKTDQDTVQLVSNYNKIFLRRYGMVGKAYSSSDKLNKVLARYKGNKMKVILGDNSLICSKYELPVDYIDLASNLNRVETKDKIYYFDQDIYYKKYNADMNIGIPYSVDKATSKVNYYTPDVEETISYTIANELCNLDEDLRLLYKNTASAKRLNYSESSILANKIPLAVHLGYHLGLTDLLKRAKITYHEGKGLRPKDDSEAVIKFSDGNIVYKATYEASMLLNGLSECDTQNYTIGEMDKRTTWLDLLENFGGRVLSDGLENFKDLFMDPITVEICKDCKLPTDYIDLLIYANNLLSDNKYNRHTDITGNRYRTNEIVAAYFYIALAKAYERYANGIRRGVKAPMTMKQTAVIDMILTSNISSDLSTLNPLLELTTAGTVTFKGPSGMNSDRAYGLDKRTYDNSMINKLALSTGFAANVGIDRQTTIDMDIEGTRGYVKNTDLKDVSITKTFSMSEAVTPFGVTRETI